MKVIFMKDVPRIGRKFEVKDMPDGYALNFLLPRKLAVRATPDAILRLEKEQKIADSNVEASRAAVKALANSLKETPVSVLVEANDKGGLFKAVHQKEIAKAIRDAGHKVDEESIIIETPIKSLGEHTIVLARGGAEESVTITIAQAK